MGTFACQPVSDLPTNPSVEGRLSSRIEVVCLPGEAADAIRDCWRWTGYTDRAGHARFKCGGVTHYARRLLYEMVVGPVPAGLFLIETCPHRWCINPLHHEPVTRGEILLRRPATVAARNYTKTHCVNGHSLDDAANVRFQRVRGRIVRKCSECRRGGPSVPVASGTLGLPLSVALSEARDDFERGIITAAIAQADGNVAKAARGLQTDRANLYRRMRRLGIEKSRRRPPAAVAGKAA